VGGYSFLISFGDELTLPRSTQFDTVLNRKTQLKFRFYMLHWS